MQGLDNTKENIQQLRIKMLTCLSLEVIYRFLVAERQFLKARRR